MMPTPNLYVQTGVNPFEAVPPVYRTNQARLIYATDRMQIPQPESNRIEYGYARSARLAVGTATVTFGQDTTWDDLVKESLSERRDKHFVPTVTGVEEVFSLPEPTDYLNPDVEALTDAAPLLNIEQLGADHLQQMVAEYVNQGARREAYVFVHGYNVNFDEAVRVMAELWHFMGRDGVPVVYTWPAGHGGIRGYSIDRESGEFTIWHLKRFLLALAACPDLDRIHIIAHSRGTDVVLTALRELHQYYQGAQQNTQQKLKLGNVVLAAPDLDLQVTVQRIIPEGVGSVPERMTIYISQKDRAIEASSWLFGSVARLGQLTASLLLPAQIARLDAIQTVDLVDTRTKRADLYGHSYFYQSPAVSSDLILLLRDGCAPGSDAGRPLTPYASRYWILEEGYPGPSSPSAPSVAVGP